MSLFSGDYTKKLQDGVKEFTIKMVVKDLVKKKQHHHKGYLCRQTPAKAMSALTAVGISISKNTLCQKVTRALQSSNEKPHDTDSESDDDDCPPARKKKKPSPENELAGSESLPSKNPVRVVLTVGGSSTTMSTLTTNSPVEKPHQPTSGRPKGTTVESKRKAEVRYKMCMANIAFDYSTKLAEAKLDQKRVPKGWLAKHIAAKKKEFGVSCPISESTIRTRVCQGKSLDPKHPGAVSPMAEAESMIVEICIQMGKIRQPLNVT